VHILGTQNVVIRAQREEPVFQVQDFLEELDIAQQEASQSRGITSSAFDLVRGMTQNAQDDLGAHVEVFGAQIGAFEARNGSLASILL
jgi:hypothetical protein